MGSVYTKRLVVCVNERLGFQQKSCGGSGSRVLIKKLQENKALRELGIEIVEQVCLGRCEQGITMRIAPGGPFFTRVTEQDLEQVVRGLIDFKPEV
jgi:(2Fe-2S) ferredoxin